MRGKTGEICKRGDKRETKRHEETCIKRERERERERESKHAVNWKQRNNN
jgi:hypothetical protein